MIWDTSGDRVTLWGTDGNPVLGGGGSTPPPGEGTDPAVLTTLRQVTDRTGWWRQTTIAGASGTVMVSEHTAATAARDLRIRWGVHGWAGADDGITGRAGLMIRGRYWRLTWDGDDLVTIPRLGHKTSDPLPVQVEAGDTIHAVWEAVPGSPVPSGNLGWDTPTTALINGAFTGVPAMGRTMLSGAPQGIYGLTFEDETASVALVGDSFLEAGWGRGALAAIGGFAWTDLSQWAEGTPTGDIEGRLSMSEPSPFKTIVTAYGGNNSIQPLADQQETHIAHWRALAGTGARVAAMTLHPYTTSTDAWTTVGGQALASDRDQPARVARNEWLRDGAPLDTTTWEPYPTGTTDPSAIRIGQAGHPVAYPVFDQADACETARNSGIWRVDGGAWTVDGAHLTGHGSAMLQPHFEAWVRENLT